MRRTSKKNTEGALPYGSTEKALSGVERPYISPTSGNGKAINKRVLKIMEKYDKDHDGIFSAEEVAVIVEDELKWEGVAGFFFVAFLVALGFLVAGTYGANELSKESHINPEQPGGGAGSVAKMQNLDGMTVHTQASMQQVTVKIDGDAIVAARMKASGSADDEPEMVVVGSVNRTVFLNGVNEVKTSARTGTAMVTKECTVFFYDYAVRSVSDFNGDYVIGLSVDMEEPGTGNLKKQFFNIHCAPYDIDCSVERYFDKATKDGLSRRMTAIREHMGARALAGTTGATAPTELASALGSKDQAGGSASGTAPAGPTDDATLAAWFALGWSGYSGSSSCRQHADTTTAETKKFIAETKTKLTINQIANLFGIPKSECVDYDTKNRKCLDGRKNVPYYLEKDNIQVDVLPAADLYSWFIATPAKKTDQAQLVDPALTKADQTAGAAWRKNVFDANVDALKKVNRRLAHSWQDDVLNRQSDCAAVANSGVTGTDPAAAGRTTCLASGFEPSAEDITGTKRALAEGSLFGWAGREAKRRLETVFTDLTETVDFTTFQNPLGRSIVGGWVHDQLEGMCQNDWIIAAHEVASAQVSKGTGAPPERLASSYYAQCKLTNYQCTGGSVGKAMQSIASEGTYEEDDYLAQDPINVLQPVKGQSVGKCYDAKMSAASVKKHYLKGLGRHAVDWVNGKPAPADMMKEAELMNLLKKNGPLAIAIQSPMTQNHDISQTYTAEKWKVKGDVEGFDVLKTRPDHVVTLVGYGVDSKGYRYWKIKNTWGKQKFDGGYMRIERGQHVLGIGAYQYWAAGAEVGKQLEEATGGWDPTSDSARGASSSFLQTAGLVLVTTLLAVTAQEQMLD